MIYPPLVVASVEHAIVVAAKALNGFVAAPVPDPDAYAPRLLGATGPEVAPSMFKGHRNYRGDGFIPDSSPQISQQSRRVSLPGISVKVPLY